VARAGELNSSKSQDAGVRESCSHVRPLFLEAHEIN